MEGGMKSKVTKSVVLIFLFLGAYIPIFLTQDFSPPDNNIEQDYGSLPLYFVPNQGQINGSALFYSRTSHYTLWFAQTALYFDQFGQIDSFSSAKAGDYRRDVSRLEFLGANPHAIISPTGSTRHKVNYFRGADSSQWCRDIPTSRAILYRELYDHIDLKVYGKEKQIEYDWIVKPGGDVTNIRFQYEGMRGVRLDRYGDLIITTEFGTIKHAHPYCYQIIADEKIEIPGQFVRLQNNTYGFDIGDYNTQHELVIDPVILVFSTYLGGGASTINNRDDRGESIAVDAKGNAYITGTTYCRDFPTTTGTYQETHAGVVDIFVTKINPSGTALLYSTFIGGPGMDFGKSISVNWKGAVSVAGSTSSPSLPLKNPMQAQPNGKSDLILLKLNAQGNELLYCTYLGGSDEDYPMHLVQHKDGSSYIAGYTYSSDFPTTAGAFQDSYGGGGQDGFILRISSNGKNLIYSTNLGGVNRDRAYGIAVDKKGYAYITGDSSSYNFPVTDGAFQTAYEGNSDAFVTKLNPKGSDLVYSTFFGGGCYDYSMGIDIDKKGCAYIIGQTASENLPLKNPVITKKTGCEEAFVTKFNKTGSDIIYSTYLGGKDGDAGRRIAVHRNGFAYVTGITSSKNFPLVNPIQAKYGGGTGDAFITKFNKKGNKLLFSTYFGGSDKDYIRGIAVMKNKTCYVFGLTYSKNIPTKNAFQAINKGDSDTFIVKLK